MESQPIQIVAFRNTFIGLPPSNQMLLYSEFHGKASDDYNLQKIELNSGYCRGVTFQKDSLNLTFNLQKIGSNEHIARVIYFLSEEDISRLALMKSGTL